MRLYLSLFSTWRVELFIPYIDGFLNLQNLGDSRKPTESATKNFVSIQCPVLTGIMVLLFTSEPVYYEKRVYLPCSEIGERRGSD